MGGILKKRSIGLDIADRSVEVVEIEKSGTAIKILKKNRVVLQKGTVERGRVKDKKSFVKILNKLFKEAKPGPIDKEEIIFGLPEAQTYPLIFRIDLKKRGIKKLSEKERENIIFDRVKKNIPISNDEVVYDSRIIKQTKDFEEIVVIATNKKVITSWQNIFKEANLKVKIFDFESLAIYRGLEKGKDKEAVCVVDIGAITTNYSIYSSGYLKYEYSYPRAGNHITRVLAKELSIKAEEAEGKKFNINILEGNKLANIAIKAIQPIMDELKSSLEYFEKKYGEKVKKVILVGGSSGIKGLEKYFSTNIEKEVVIGKTLVKDKGPNQLYIEAIGLAMKGIGHAGKEPHISSDIIAHGKKIKEDYKDPEENIQPSMGSGSKKKIVIFLLIILIGVLAVAFSFWYRGESRDKRNDIQESMMRELEDIPEPKIEEAPVEIKVDLVATSTEEEIATSTEIEVLEDIQEEEIIATEENVLEEEIVVENLLQVKETPTGWLNVRVRPSTDSEIIIKVYTGENYKYLDKSGSWYLIQLDSSEQGWVHEFYIEIK